MRSRNWISAKINDEQVDAIDYACKRYDCSKSELMRILLSPFVFALSDKDVPIREEKWREFRRFIDECVRIKRTI